MSPLSKVCFRFINHHSCFMPMPVHTHKEKPNTFVEFSRLGWFVVGWRNLCTVQILRYYSPESFDNAKVCA